MSNQVNEKLDIVLTVSSHATNLSDPPKFYRTQPLISRVRESLLPATKGLLGYAVERAPMSSQHPHQFAEIERSGVQTPHWCIKTQDWKIKPLAVKGDNPVERSQLLDQIC